MVVLLCLHLKILLFQRSICYENEKFLASVLAALMAVSSMSFIASAQETETDATLAETVEITFNRRNGAFAKTTSDTSMYATTTASFEAGQPVHSPHRANISTTPSRVGQQKLTAK